MRVLRIATYNTRDFLDDRAAAARVVRDLEPDILCLQEVPRRLGAPLRVARFARECGLRWVGNHRGSGGTTIFHAAGVAVESAWHRGLPVRWGQRTRGYAAARFALPGWPALTVASVHLSLNAQERERHTKLILADLDRHRADGGEIIIAGDLNEGASGAAYARLAAALTLVSPPEPTFPAGAPRAALDLIFASAGVRVHPSRPVRLAEADLRAASDHRPAWVDLVPAVLEAAD